MPRFSPATACLLCLLTCPAFGQAQTTTPAEGSTADTATPDTQDQPKTVVGDNPKLESPEAVYEAAKTAFNGRDWSGFLDLVSPERRDEIIGQTAMTFAFMAEQPEADPKVIEVVKEYLPDNVNATQLQMGTDDPKAERVRLAKRMGKPEEFFAAAMNLGLVLEHGDKAPEVQVVAMNDLETEEDGQSAKALAVVDTPDGQRKMRWAFEQYKGYWYLSMQ